MSRPCAGSLHRGGELPRRLVFTVALDGEIPMLTDAVCTIATQIVFETSPSGVATYTRADGFADGALPVPVSTLGETNVVGSIPSSTEMIGPDV